MKKIITIDGVEINKWTPLKIDSTKAVFSIKDATGLPMVEAYQKAVTAALDKVGFVKTLNKHRVFIFIDELDYGCDVPTKWLSVCTDKMMKTKLPLRLTTVDEAKAFLSELHKNSEAYHPEDDATTIIINDKHPHKGKPLFNLKEGEQLNNLMNDIYSFEGQQGSLAKVFCPCEYLLYLDGRVDESIAFEV